MSKSSASRPRDTNLPKPAMKRQGILVLGMHRSGTSALTRVLNLLGCALPERLLGVGDGNEAGHWESASLVELNDEILASAGSSWKDWGPLNDDWRDSAIRRELLARAVGLVEEHVELGPVFVMKDPRLCRLADIWLKAMGEANAEALVALVMRNPAEVATSLEERDLMALGYGQLLWLRHTLDAEFFTRGIRRIVCRYDQLMTNWQAVTDRVRNELGVALPRNSPSVHFEIDQFISKKHRHYVSDAEAVTSNLALSAWLRRTFIIMQSWSEGGENPADHSELDQIRLEFDNSYLAFARLLLPGGLSGDAGLGSHLKRELTNQLAKAQQAEQAAQIASQEAQSLLEAAASREAELGAETVRLEAEVAARNADASEERDRRLEAENQLAKVMEELHQSQLRNSELTGSLAVAQSTLAQRQEELAQFMVQLSEAERASAMAKADEKVAEELLFKAERRNEANAARIDELVASKAKDRAVADMAVAQLNAEITQLSQALKDQEAEVRAGQGACARAEQDLAIQIHIASELRAKLEQQEKARSLADQSLAVRVGEVAELNKILAEEAGRASKSDAKLQWLRRVSQVAAGFPRWWFLMPRSWRLKQEHARYLRHGLFDAQRYLDANPDVAAEAMDPIRHYILHGMAEGRCVTK
ncbi:MAG: hypothetical protein KGM83_11215 [Betaproteobacteria bacterium]|nr:hypothetical protein [Betaproteobacteria bacterium]